MSQLESIELLKRGRTFRVVTSENEPFWRQLEKNEWEEGTFSIFDKFIRSNVVYLDVGCWIGPTVFYGAQLAKATYAFEPDPVAYSEFRRNLKLNDDVSWSKSIQVYNMAVAARSGFIEIGSRSLGGDSTSSVLFAGHRTNWKIEATSLEDFVRRESISGERIFLKIDIEGGEFELIPSVKELLREENITLYLSIHTQFLASSILSGRRGILSKVRRRLKVWFTHLELCRALPFNHLYNTDGSKLYLRIVLLVLLFRGRFPTEIVGCKASWNDI